MIERRTITSWALDERPREKLMKKGPGALTTAELLAILIGSGNTEETAVELMSRLMDDCKGKLQTLSRMSIEELASDRYRGMGPAKAVTILAACELGRRRSMEPSECQKMKSSAEIAAYFQPMLQDLSHEECHVMLLRNNLSLIDTCLISKGGLTASTVDVRSIVRKALLANATAIVLCHNHPSGSLTPSTADVRLTHQVKEACEVMQITLIDHLVVSAEGYYSFADEGRM